MSVVNRDGELKITGEPENVMLADKAIEALLTLSARGESISEQNVRYVIESGAAAAVETSIGELAEDVVCITAKGKPIKAKTIGPEAVCGRHQEEHRSPSAWAPPAPARPIWRWRRRWPPSGTRQVNRIILTRPAVEAGERLGFLPGDLQSKVDPYLRPLYDALFDMLGPETYQKYLERGNIEVAPLAYMRGRTLDDSFIILDEAQNTSREQMKMFLTRLGFGSKVVITGDITQIDLPGDKASAA